MSVIVKLNVKVLLYNKDSFPIDFFQKLHSAFKGFFLFYMKSINIVERISFTAFSQLLDESYSNLCSSFNLIICHS